MVGWWRETRGEIDVVQVEDGHGWLSSGIGCI